jgi:dienelactone hydrolase
MIWMRWPQHELYSLQFMRILQFAEAGASTIRECYLAADQIRPGDSDSWYREWKHLADDNRARGEQLLGEGHVRLAKNLFLRAAAYYRSAELFLADCDERRRRVLDAMQRCSQQYLRGVGPSAEIVEIGHADEAVAGYFIPGANGGRKRPAVICVNGEGEPKDGHLFRIAVRALGRGLSLLLVDLPSQLANARRSLGAGRYEVEAAISACVDYLLTRGDVDGKRIVIYGDGLGASYAARAASVDSRFAAAVCDGGLFDSSYGRSLLGSFAGQPQRRLPDPGFHYEIARNISCPFLITINWDCLPDTEAVMRLFEYCRSSGIRADLEPSLLNVDRSFPDRQEWIEPDRDFIFDWIALKLAERH